MSGNYVGKSPGIELASQAAAFGQVRLTKSGANLLLSPCDGRLLTVDQVARVVPAAGVTLAPTGLAVDTTFYIYAYMLAGALTLEASTTAPVVDSTTGLKVKTGDTSRTLVGMARTLAGPAWADTTTARLVLSYFNRRGVFGVSFNTASRNIVGATWQEVHAEFRILFLTWADEIVSAECDGIVQQAQSSSSVLTAIGIDSVTAVVHDNANRYQAWTNGSVGALATSIRAALAEGYHYATLLGQAVSGSTATWLVQAASPGERCSLKLETRG